MRRFTAFLLVMCLIATSMPFMASALTEDGEPITEGYYTYAVYSYDGVAEILRVDKSISGDVTVPATLGGYPVTAILYGAFSGNSNITSVTIPANVTVIMHNAFHGCENFTAVFFEETGYWSNGGAPIDPEELEDPATAAELLLGNHNYYGDRFERRDRFGIWKFIVSQGEAVLVETFGISGDVVIPATYEGCPVVGIDMHAFENNVKITSVVIPKSVSTIAPYAFSNCDSLTDAYFEDPNGWYRNDVKISASELADSETAARYLFERAEWYKEYDDECIYTYNIYDGEVTITDVDENVSGDVTVPSTLGGYPVTGIGLNAFTGCSLIETITIPSGITDIDWPVFAQCDALTEITVDENNPVYHSDGNCLIETETKTLVAGCKTSVIPSDGSVTSIGQCAFYYNDGLISITIPESIDVLGYHAFSNCENLAEINILGNLIEIGISAFDDTAYYNDESNWEDGILYIDEYLVGVYGAEGDCVIKPGTKTIARFVFSFGYENITGISIPESLTNIGDNAFESCEQLVKITVDENNPVYHSDGNCLIETETKTLVAGCKASVIPSDGSVTSIESSAFEGQIELSSITIPETVTEIGSYAFRGCSSLSSITIPNSIKCIDHNAFESCENLKNVYFENPNNWNAYIWAGEYAIFSHDDISNPQTAAQFLTDTYCDYTWEPYNDFYFSIYNDEAILAWAHPLLNGDIEIPSTYEGYPVTEISSYVFHNNNNITSVIIPETVEFIGAYAFKECANLTDIYFLKNKRWRYYWENNYADIMPEELADSSKVAGYLTSDYAGGYWKILPDFSYEIYDGGAYITYVDTTLTGDILIPSVIDGYPVTGIDEFAFSNAYNITSVTIPASVTNIRGGIFECCHNIEALIVDENNPVYHSDGNCIIETGTKTLVAGCKTSVIPSDGSVTSIAPLAFFACFGLRNIVIPEGVEDIGYGAFELCVGIEEVNIPKSVTNIGSGAFIECESLTAAYFENTLGWKGYYDGLSTIIPYEELSDPETAAECLSSSYANHYWYKESEEDIELLTFEIYDDEAWLTDAYYGLSGDVEIPATYEGYPVTSIADCAFMECENITSVTIPASVTYIGSDAFYGCESLTAVYFEDAEYWLVWNDPIPSEEILDPETAAEYLTSPYYRSSWEKSKPLTFEIYDGEAWLTVAYENLSGDVEIPATYEGYPVTAIADYAFMGCENITGVTIPASVKIIGSDAFYFCTGLESVTIPKGVTSIGKSAFGNCRSLKSISIPASVTSIGEGAFIYCNSIESITVNKNNSVYRAVGNCLIEKKTRTIVQGCNNSVIPTDGSVTAIGYCAFVGCTGLESINIPAGVTSIGEGAFSGTSITSINIPASVTSIGYGIVLGCPYLETITVSENNPVYHSDGNCLIETAKKTLIQGCNNSVIPTDGSVTVIGYCAFTGCNEITSLNIPEGVTYIDYGAFGQCESLESVTIPDSVTYIGERAFAYCYSLETATLGDGVVYIGDRAFDGAALGSVTIPASTEYIGANIFSSCESLANVYFENTEGWSGSDGILISPELFENSEAMAEAFKDWSPFLARFGVGDIDGVYGKGADDAIYLLYNVFFGDESYPISQSCDFDGDGDITANDAIYLLYHIFFGADLYPLN